MFVFLNIFITRISTKNTGKIFTVYHYHENAFQFVVKTLNEILTTHRKVKTLIDFHFPSMQITLETLTCVVQSVISSNVSIEKLVLDVNRYRFSSLDFSTFFHARVF